LQPGVTPTTARAKRGGTPTTRRRRPQAAVLRGTGARAIGGKAGEP